MNSPDKELTFGLVHGSWHDKRCWSRLEGDLRARGHRTLAMDLDPHVNLNKQARAVARALDAGVERGTPLILVGHSRGANVVPRVAGFLKKAVAARLILVAGSLLPETIGHQSENLPPRNYPRFQDAITQDRHYMSRIDPKQAIDLLYNLCEPDIAAAAVRRLRPWPRGRLEPVLSEWPNAATFYLRPTNDRIIRPEWVDTVAPLVGADVVNIPGDHSPMLSRPVELARTIIDLAIKNVGADTGSLRIPAQRPPSLAAVTMHQLLSRQAESAEGLTQPLWVPGA